MTNGNNLTITAADQFILGAFIAVGIGIFALLDQIYNSGVLWAIVAGYAASGIAYGVYLMEYSTAIHSWWKYIAIIVVTIVAYASTKFATLLGTPGADILNPVLIAAFVVTIANFALNDLQTYKQFLPDNVITEITIIIGGIVVVAQSVQNAPQGSIINVTTFVTTALPVLLVYIFQKIPWPSSLPAPPAAPAPTTSTPTTTS